MSKKRVLITFIVLFVTMVIALTCIQCSDDKQPPISEDIPTAGIIVIDSCEYVYAPYAGEFEHKGNCKYCEERRKQELNEIKQLIRELKEN